MKREEMKRASLALLALTASACVTARHGRPEWLPAQGAEQSPSSVFGVQATLELSPLEADYGELIACEQGTVYLRVFDPAGYDRIERVSLSMVRRVVVHGSGEVIGASVWSVLGFVSSLSHGWWFGLSGLAWGVIGPISGVSAHRARGVEPTCEAVRPYARFPQGLPPNTYDEPSGAMFFPEVGRAISGGRAIPIVSLPNDGPPPPPYVPTEQEDFDHRATVLPPMRVTAQ